MKGFQVFLLAFILMIGCDGFPHSLTTSEMIITPGVGVSNFVSLNMTLSEMSRKTGELLIHENKEPNPADGSFRQYVRAPSVGIEWEQKTQDQRPYLISFCVASDAINRVFFDVTKHGKSRFCGRMAEGLSFATDGGVSRKRLVECFGPPLHDFSKTVIGKEDRDLMTKWVRCGESYSMQDAKAKSEYLMYPDKGVSFVLSSNVVILVNVFRPACPPRPLCP